MTSEEGGEEEGEEHRGGGEKKSERRGKRREERGERRGRREVRGKKRRGRRERDVCYPLLDGSTQQPPGSREKEKRFTLRTEVRGRGGSS